MVVSAKYATPVAPPIERVIIDLTHTEAQALLSVLLASNTYSQVKINLIVDLKKAMGIL